jgi:predicted RND superfamily exporter protein
MKMHLSGKQKSCLLILIAGLIVISATAGQTVYSNTSNKELKPRVMRLVKDIRELVYAHKKQDDEMLATVDKRDRADATKEERKRLRDEWVRKSNATHDSFMRQYKEKYWADAILYRNELLRRLPKNLQQAQLSGIYQYPTNLLGVEAVADNLELLAKSLPDS